MGGARGSPTSSRGSASTVSGTDCSPPTPRAGPCLGLSLWGPAALRQPLGAPGVTFAKAVGPAASSAEGCASAAVSCFIARSVKTS